jgi:hypothetical protein
MKKQVYYLTTIGRSLHPVKLAEQWDQAAAQAHADLLADELGRTITVTRIGRDNKSETIYQAYSA